MGRSINDIKTQILAEKASLTELDDLNSVSNSAIYMLWIYLAAAIQSMFERVMDLFKADVQAIIDNNQYGNDQWWYKKVIAFQYGDILAFIDNIYQYALIDPAKQIVGFCSITSNGGKVQIKAAASVSGQPAVLTSDQVAGLLAYCKTIRPSGIKFTVQSLAADTLKAYLNVYYDASGDITIIKAAVNAAIQGYLSNLNTVTFDGTLFVNKLIDAIQVVPGVVANQADVIQISAKNGSDAYQVFTSSYAPKAGYFKIDPDFPLDDTITYIAA